MIVCSTCQNHFHVLLYFCFDCIGGKSLPPPKLEPLNSSPPLVNSDSHSEPPMLKPIKSNGDKTFKCNGVKTATSVPRDTLNGHNPLVSDSHLSVGATSTLAEPSSMGNRRTNVLFRKSKNASPQKPPRTAEHQLGSPLLGTKTFLSVVIPRLETLLLPRKRTHSACGDCDQDEEESPIKRLDTGKAQCKIEIIQKYFFFLHAKCNGDTRLCVDNFFFSCLQD